MPIKKWSTGQIGNTYPERLDTENPNTRGLDSNNQLGVEAYIEEDPVIASSDNRPLKNLVENDGILAQNASDVASEVDNGIFKNKYNEFNLSILSAEDYPDPETDEPIRINKLRINSGSNIIDGEVVRTGSQKILYFYRKEDGSILFPPVLTEKQIQITDPDYFSETGFGEYIPAYNSLSEPLPDDYTEYIVTIINTDSGNPSNTKTTVFETYRDWEDIIPFKAESTSVNNEHVDFINDLNYGQYSEGYWFGCGGVVNTRVSNVQVKKDIIIQDKLFSGDEFTLNSGKYQHPLVTDGLFFHDIQMAESVGFDSNKHIQDLYVDDKNDIYFIQRSDDPKLYRVQNNSTQIDENDLNSSPKINLGIKRINDFIAIYGTDGLLKFVDINNWSTTAINSTIVTTETINDIYIWDDKIWVAGDTILWYSDNSYDTFIPGITTFTNIDLSLYIVNTSDDPIIEKITKLEEVEGNYITENSSTLISTTKNLLSNPSFEQGGLGNLPTNWEFNYGGSGTGSLIVNNSSSIRGNYSAVLTKNLETWVSATQSIKHQNISSYVFSVYLKSAAPQSVKLRITQINNADEETIQTEATYSITDSWERFVLGHTISGTDIKNIKVSIINEEATSISIDAAQLETSVLTNYTENFNHLFIGFKKVGTDITNPPFALIDFDDKYNVKYSQEKYGYIKQINDVIATGNNGLDFIDDKNIYHLVFLNNKDEYDRFTITDLYKDDINQTHDKIRKYESIRKFKDKIFYGGTVDNRVIQAVIPTNGNHTISFETPGTGFSLLTLLGPTTFVDGSSSTKAMIQFDRIDFCNEAASTSLGNYQPNSSYHFKIRIDDITPIELAIQSPLEHEGPWTIAQIRDLIAEAWDIIPDKPDLVWSETEDPAPIYSDWPVITSSIRERDGFYSTNGKNEFKHLRGNIHKIFIRSQNDENFYVVKDNKIFQTKYDLNVLKIDDIYEPYNWELYNTDYSLDLQKVVVNQEIIFNDDTNNRHYIPILVDENYKILNGSVRVKTNPDSEVGFCENEDFFVDYENSRIIRNNTNNLIANPEFDLGFNNWAQYGSGSGYLVLTDTSKFSDHVLGFWADVTPSTIYQKITTPLNVGKTYTFSIYIKSEYVNSPTIRLLECRTANENSFVDGDFGPNEISSAVCSVTNGWTRFSISHTVVNALSTKLRIEIKQGLEQRLLITKAQLERNNFATPYVNGSSSTNIDPDMTVWIDFIQYKQLDQTEYTFDTVNRKLILEETPEPYSNYYFTYKYNKIFNAYYYPDSKPIKAIIPDYRDDYFLFELEGKIWAIDQMFALLSLDLDNPLIVSYDYHYPRVDQIKIRNTPDVYGNYLYIVKGTAHYDNPYKPVDKGTTLDRYVNNIDPSTVDIHDLSQLNNTDNDVLYEIYVTSDNYNKNDIYDRRVFVDAKNHTAFNISLYPETVAYFPFIKDFNSTNGLMPLNLPIASKIIPIIKNYNVIQTEEVGSWGTGYQLNLRDNENMVLPDTGAAIFLDPINGNNTNNGQTAVAAVKTFARALELINELERPNIIITSQSIITENVEINKYFTVKIFAQTYCYWQGGLQTLSQVKVQGIWFRNTNIYPFAQLELYFCTLENTSLNYIYPQVFKAYNTEYVDCHSPIIRVKDVIFPSPFRHPYEAFPLRDLDHDGIADNDNESIAPGDSYYDSEDPSQPTGNYYFERCLINHATDAFIKYDPEPDWAATFNFTYCTIADNVNLFITDKEDLGISFDNSIFFNNREVRSGISKIFDSDSNINFSNCYVDFPAGSDPADYNFGTGDFVLSGCITSSEAADPYFIGEYDYHLKSIARGSAVDSPCLDKGDAGDLGCYSETREQQSKSIPKKMKSYVAYIGEAIAYPIRLNSEKITITFEYKPSGSSSTPGILLDTRMAADEDDYIIVLYNNNAADDHSLIQNPLNSPDDPYRFRVIVANKEKKYSIVSPINIYTDEDYKKWHKISFTINYEQIYNTKSSFAPKDRAQNIITLYHNDSLSIESFIKYDLNRDINGELIEGGFISETNAWDFNEICQYLTIGADYQNNNQMNGYFTELRIDNRLIDRKQFALWNSKVVPFNDPMSYVNQAPLARVIEGRILNDFWSLKSTSEVGAKGSRFGIESKKRFKYEDGELVWSLVRETENMITNSNFDGISNAQLVATNLITYPITLENSWTFTTTDSRFISDNTPGIELAMAGTYASQDSLDGKLFTEFLSKTTKITYEWTPEGRLRFYTKDLSSTALQIDFGSVADETDVGFTGGVGGVVEGNRTLEDWSFDGLTALNIEINNIWFTNNPDTSVSTNMYQAIIEKTDESSDVIKLYQPVVLLNTENYCFSAYIYYNGALTNEHVKCLVNGVQTNWDSVERYKDSWWICKIKISDSSNISLGISIHKTGTYQITATQLEQNYFVSPYVKLTTNDNGGLLINRGMLNKNTGLIFLKFKPLFDFYSTERCLLESIDEELGYNNNGFRISYVFDEEKNRGKIKFFIKNLQSAIGLCEFEIVNTYWHQWHSLALCYDFNINRFIFRYDNYSYILDQEIISDWIYSDFWIGHCYPGTGRTELEYAADIDVKDIIITNYTISDNELLNWTNAYSFYNESLLINTIDEYRKEISTSIETANNFVNIMNNILTEVDELKSSVINLAADDDEMADDITDLTNRMDTLENTVNGPPSLSSRITDVENDIITIQGDMVTINSNMSDLNDRVDDVELDISTEINNRVAADTQIREDLASDATTFGASLVGVALTVPAIPLDAHFINTTVETVLREISGSGRTTETIKGNANSIVVLDSAINDINDALDLMQDGNTGTWTDLHAQNDGWNIADIRSDVDEVVSDISDLTDTVNAVKDGGTGSTWTTENLVDHENRIGDLETTVDSHTSTISDHSDAISDLQTADSDLFSTDFGKGASLIGIHDPDDKFVAANVEEALIELFDNLGGISFSTSWKDPVSTYTNLPITDNILGDTIAVLDENSQYICIAIIGTREQQWKKIADVSWGSADNIAIVDTDENFDATNVEDALTELHNSIIPSWKENVSTYTNLPIIDNTLGDVRIVADENSQYICIAITGLRTEQWLKMADSEWNTASEINIADTGENFAAINVEDALSELAESFSSLSSGLHWKSSVPTYTDLPIVDNVLSDARIVMNDGDTNPAQYVCIAIVGTREQQWQKIADINWGSADVITITDSEDNFVATNVEDALTELYNTTKQPSITQPILTTDWTPDGDLYYYDVVHNLNTTNVSSIIFNQTTGLYVLVDEIETIDENTIRVWTTDNADPLNIKVFGSPNKYSIITNEWIADGDRYYIEITENVGEPFLFSVFDVQTKCLIGLDDIDISTNFKIWSTENTATVNVYLTSQLQMTMNKTIKNWTLSGGFYKAEVQVGTGFDAVYTIIDLATGNVVGVEEIRVENGVVTITKSDNSPVKLVILQ